MAAVDIEASLTAANARVDAALAVADRALAQLADAQTALTGERARIIDLQHALDAANAEAQQAAKAASTVRRRAEGEGAAGRVAGRRGGGMGNDACLAYVRSVLAAWGNGVRSLAWIARMSAGF